MKTCLRWAFIFSTLLWGTLPARSHSHRSPAPTPNSPLHY